MAVSKVVGCERKRLSDEEQTHQSRVGAKFTLKQSGRLGQKDIPMSQVEQGKKIADEAVSAARDSWNKRQAATEQTAHAGQEAFSASAEGARDFNRKVIEMAKTNTNAMFDFALKVAGAKEPSQIMELWSRHMQQQFEVLRKQSQELTSMGQKVATASTEPLSRVIDKTSKM
jgi:hypothetical protein